MTLARLLHQSGLIMKTIENRRVLTFGELIAATFAARGGRGAAGFLRLAVNAHLVAFPGRQRFMIVKEQHEGHRF
jgi:hypothetical protein